MTNEAGAGRGGDCQGQEWGALSIGPDLANATYRQVPWPQQLRPGTVEPDPGRQYERVLSA